MTKSKRPVIRVGDRIRIVNSRFIKRVGYPVIWTDIAQDVAKDKRTLAAYRLLDETLTVSKVTTKLHLDADDDMYANDPHYRRFVRAVAMKRVEQMRFGGNERTLHYYMTVDRTGMGLGNLNEDQRLDMTGEIMTVIGKKVAKTGIRFAPWSGTSGYDGEYNYEPGGLENEVTHVLLDTSHGLISRDDVELLKDKAERVADAINAAFGRLYEPITMRRLQELLHVYDPELVREVALKQIAAGKLKVDEGSQLLPRLNRIPSLAELRARFAGIPELSGKVR
jgi:hypothetical protein